MIKKQLLAINFVIFWTGFPGWTQSNSCKVDMGSCTEEQHSLIESSAYYNGPYGWFKLKSAGVQDTCYLNSGTDFKILDFFPSEELVLVKMEDGEINHSECKKNDRIFLPKEVIITKDVVVDESIESVDKFSKDQLVYFRRGRNRSVRIIKDTLLKQMLKSNTCFLEGNAELKVLGFSVDREFVLVEVEAQDETYADNCKKGDTLFLLKHDLNP